MLCLFLCLLNLLLCPSALGVQRVVSSRPPVLSGTPSGSHPLSPPYLTREHCVRIANGVLKVLLGSKENLKVVQELRDVRSCLGISGVSPMTRVRGDPSQGAIAGVFQSVHRYPGTKKARQGMPHHQRGLMRRKCWRCQQHNLVESDGDAVGVVCELPKKMGVDPNHPRHDALPPHQQGRQIHIDKGGSNRRSSKVQTTAGVSDP